MKCAGCPFDSGIDCLLKLPRMKINVLSPLDGFIAIQPHKCKQQNHLPNSPLRDNPDAQPRRATK